jgi:hypothetical protein
LLCCLAVAAGGFAVLNCFALVEACFEVSRIYTGEVGGLLVNFRRPLVHAGGSLKALGGAKTCTPRTLTHFVKLSTITAALRCGHCASIRPLT